MKFFVTGILKHFNFSYITVIYKITCQHAITYFVKNIHYMQSQWNSRICKVSSVIL